MDWDYPYMYQEIFVSGWINNRQGYWENHEELEEYWENKGELYNWQAWIDCGALVD